jgi:hypothetical protein
VEHQKRESLGIKTHEEIIALFKSLESIEEKVKNPEMRIEGLFESDTTLQEVESPHQTPIESVHEQPLIEPSGEIPSENKTKQKRSLFSAHERKEPPAELKKRRLSSWRKTKIGEFNPDEILNDQQHLEPNAPSRSTFTLQFDADGNLVGFPLKKLIPEHEKKGWFFFRKKGDSEQPEEEPAKGIKGKLLRVVSKLKRKKSSEGESSGGIGGKLKGLLKRKSKE